MENLIRFIKIDIVVQKVLFFLVVITGIFLMPLFITMPTLGAWQLFSAFTIRWRLKDEIRKRYLLFSIAYLGLMFGSVYMQDNFRFDAFDYLLPLIFILIPFGIAIWYFIKTKNTLKELKKLGIVEMPEEMENILDSEEIFKPEEKL